MVIIALMATSGTSQWQQQLCEKAKNLLVENNIPHEILDGMEVEETRNHLFFLAGMLASYPQFFVRDEKNEIVYLGNFDAIRRLVDEKSNFISNSKKPEKEDQKQTPLKYLRRCFVKKYSREFKEAPGAMNMMKINPQVTESSPRSTLIISKKRAKPRRFQLQESNPSSQGANITALTSKPTSQMTPQSPNSSLPSSIPLTTDELSFDEDDVPLHTSKSTEKPNESANKSLRPSVTRGNSSYEEISIKMAQSKRPATRRNSYEEDLPLEAEQMIRTSQSLRPSTIRGNSFDDDNSSHSEDQYDDSVKMHQVSTMRPSFTRGNSFDAEPNDAEKASKGRCGSLKVVWPPVINDKSFSMNKVLSHAGKFDDVEHASTRPPYTRGNSHDDETARQPEETEEMDAEEPTTLHLFDDDNSSHSEDQYDDSVKMRQVSTMRPSFTRGNSFDAEPNDVEKANIVRCGSLKVVWPPVINDKSLSINKDMSHAGKYDDVEQALTRPSFTRGNSYDDETAPQPKETEEVDAEEPTTLHLFDDDNSSHSEEQYDDSDKMRQVSTMRPSFTRGNSFDADPNDVENTCKGLSGSLKVVCPPVINDKSLSRSKVMSHPGKYHNSEQASIRQSFTRGHSYDVQTEPQPAEAKEVDAEEPTTPQSRLRPCILRGDSSNNIPSSPPAASSCESYDRGGQPITQRRCGLSDLHGRPFEANHSPWSGDQDWTISQERLCETKTPIAKDICAFALNITPLATKESKGAKKLQDPQSPSRFVLKRISSISTRRAPEPCNGNAVNSDDPVKDGRYETKSDATKKFSVASGPSWLYS